VQQLRQRKDHFGEFLQGVGFSFEIAEVLRLYARSPIVGYPSRRSRPHTLGVGYAYGLFKRGLEQRPFRGAEKG